MKVQEAIGLLENLDGMIEDNHKSDYDSAFKIAIKCMEEVEQYRALEEQGLILKLPCPIGTTVYRLIDGGFKRGWYYISIEFSLREYRAYELGLIALTKEEAEAKLKKMEGE